MDVSFIFVYISQALSGYFFPFPQLSLSLSLSLSLALYISFFQFL